MPAALLEVLRMPTPRKPDPFYSPGRIAHFLGHERCCVAARKIPGTCENDPYDADRVRGTGPEPVELSGSDMYLDIFGIWNETDKNGNFVMPYDYRRVLISLVYISPRTKTELPDVWRHRQIGWWVRKRRFFRNIEPEYAVRLVDDALHYIAFKLGWRPEEEAA